MTKNKEELNANKQENEKTNNKIIKLTDEELKQVNGGIKLDPERLRKKVEDKYPTGE